METQEVRKKNKWYLPVIIISAGIVFAAIAAIIIIVSAVAVPKSKVKKQLALGEKYLSDMDYENAVLAYREAVQIDPKCEEAYLGLADSYIYLADRFLEEGDEEKALKCLRKAVNELQPAADNTDSDDIPDKIEEIEDKKAQIEDEDSESEEDTKKAEDDSEKEKESEKQEEENKQKEQEEHQRKLKDAYQAYLTFLNNNPKIKITNSWSGETYKTVSFYDCYGDDIPEMAYAIEKKYDYYDGLKYSELHLVTYRDGNIVELTDGFGFDGEEAGTPHLRLFCTNDKQIYLIQGYGDDYWDTNLYYMEDSSDGRLNEKLVYSDHSYPNDDHTQYIHDFSKFGNKISKEEALNETDVLIKDVTIIFECDLYAENRFWTGDGDIFNINSKITKRADFMTYDDAIAYLNNLLSQ